MRQLLYVAHCLRPTPEELDDGAKIDSWDSRSAHRPADVIRAALTRNIDRAMLWLSWLSRSFPETTFIAPWIASVMAGADDSDPVQREAGIVDACLTIERCDGIVLCGPRISEGMRREMEHGKEFWRFQIPEEDQPWEDFKVFDLMPIGREPWSMAAWRDGCSKIPFDEWYRKVVLRT